MQLTPAMKMGLSIAIPTGIYGVSFGALAVTAGLNFWQTIILSLMMFTGGSQFAFIGTITSGGTYFSATSAAALLGVRNAIYGIQINQMLKPSGFIKLLAAHLTIDESLAVASSQSEFSERKIGFWFTAIVIFVLWNIFTAIGAIIGDVIGDPRIYGLDGAAAAAFLGLLWPRLKQKQATAIAVVCALFTAISLPFVPAGIPILIAAIVATLVGWRNK